VVHITVSNRILGFNSYVTLNLYGFEFFCGILCLYDLIGKLGLSIKVCKK